MKVLIATAVAAERDAVTAGLADRVGFDVITVGVGPAAAAAGTAWRLATVQYDLVVSAGVAGGMPGRAGIGDVVVATRSIAADLGADSPEGFLPISRLGFGNEVVDADPVLKHPDAVLGSVLSVCTVTGTAHGTEQLARRYPDAVAEAMEGFGVATAAHLAGVRFAEIRTVSNLVGPRDRTAWRLTEALTALRDAVTAVTEDLG
ncbi:MAG TPA: futalosine hydrolase [Micromonosporaceae bacterium]